MEVHTVLYIQWNLFYTRTFFCSGKQKLLLSCFPLFIQCMHGVTKTCYIHCCCCCCFIFVKAATTNDGASTMQNKKKYFICIPFNTRWCHLFFLLFCSTFFFLLTCVRSFSVVFQLFFYIHLLLFLLLPLLSWLCSLMFECFISIKTHSPIHSQFRIHVPVLVYANICVHIQRTVE